jgi:hypothetical protein
MTMAFSVKDKIIFDKLSVGQTVHVEFVQQGTDYIAISDIAVNSFDAGTRLRRVKGLLAHGLATQ